MPSLPLSTAFTDSAVTEGAFKTAMTNQREYLASLLGTDGLKSTALATLGTMFGSRTTKNSNYTVIASDNGKIIECTSTFTLALTAAATLGSSFTFIVNNVGSGVITIDPSGAEQINGEATITIQAGKSAVVYCTGTAFYTALQDPVVPPNEMFTLLGTVNTPSGNSVSISGLDLTPYKQIYFYTLNVRSASASNNVFVTSDNSQAGWSFSIGTSPTYRLLIADFNEGFGLIWGISSVDLINITSATTQIFFRLQETRTFTGGSIKIYGVK
jgi:hypothetical protein